MPFQGTVNVALAPAVQGDFASTNPRASVCAGGQAFVAGSAGVAVGLFAWVDPAGQQVVNNFGFGLPTGFVHREQQGLITAYLAEYSQMVPYGFPVTLFSAGDFFVKNAGTNEVIPGMKAYANYATGTITFNTTGTPPTGASATGVIAANSSLSFTGAIGTGGTQSDILTASNVTGTIVAGAVLSGVGVQTGTTVAAQLTGTTGGAGTYTVNIPQYTTSTTITGAYGVLTISGTVTGAFAVNDILSGVNVVAGTYITQLGTGTGGAGTYYVSNNTAVSSTTISATSAIETKWYAMSQGAAGELIKMSSWPLG